MCPVSGTAALRGTHLVFRLLVVSFFLFVSACHQPFGVYHTVERGETLSKISSYYDVPVDDLTSVNYLRHPDNLSVGDRIFVPGADKVRREPSKKAAASTKDERSTKQAATKTAAKDGQNKKQNKTQAQKKQNSSSRSGSGSGAATVAARASEKKPQFLWPVRGKILSGFGMIGGKANNGLDIGAPEGTPVKASAQGEVIYVTDNQRGYGKLILIQHPYDYITVYAHNQKNLVREGDTVQQGQTIATVGKTGNATNSHLHFEIRHKRRAVDPKSLLP